MAAARQALIKRIYEDPRNGFGSIADTLRQARQQDPAITRGDVVQFMETVKTREDRPQRGYNSFVPTEPMHQLQVDLADMSVFSAKPDSARCAPKKVRTLSDHLKKNSAAQDKRSAWVRNAAEACGPVQTAESVGSKEKPLPAHLNRSSTSRALHPNSSGEAGTEAEESDVPCFSLW